MPDLTFDSDFTFKLPAMLVKRLKQDASACEAISRKAPADFPTAAAAATALRAMLPPEPKPDAKGK